MEHRGLVGSPSPGKLGGIGGLAPEERLRHLARILFASHACRARPRASRASSRPRTAIAYAAPPSPAAILPAGHIRWALDGGGSSSSSRAPSGSSPKTNRPQGPLASSLERDRRKMTAFITHRLDHRAMGRCTSPRCGHHCSSKPTGRAMVQGGKVVPREGRRPEARSVRDPRAGSRLGSGLRYWLVVGTRRGPA